MDSTLDTADERDRWVAWGRLLFLLFFASLMLATRRTAAAAVA